MSAIRFIREKTAYIITCLILYGYLIGNMLLFKCSSYLLFIALVAMAVNIVLPILLEYSKKRKFYDVLADSAESLDKKYIICDLLQRPSFLEGEITYDAMEKINHNMMDDLTEYKHNMRDYKEYIDLWVHEIKTPVTNAKLLIENHPSKAGISIGEEIDKMEAYIEQTLYYSKANLVEKDYVIAKQSLQEIVNTSIKNNKKALIGNRIRMVLHDLEMEVQTDSKWLIFVINQILTNCVKYRCESEPVIEIFAQKTKQKTVLVIKDNGIGIKKTELEKVMLKGFVGTNGRKKEATTGMGLYLCNKLLKKMHHSIAIESEDGCYTAVMITFPLSDYYLNI